MARIKLGPVVTDIAGSIGGITIQRSKFGYTMRSKPLPLHSETSAQYTIRRLITSLQHSWQDLTDAQRLQWNRFLDYSGQTINRDPSVLLTGHPLYLKYQLWRLMYDQALLTTIAYSPMPSHYILNLINRTEEVLNLNFSGSVDSSKYFFICKLSTPRNYSQAYSSKGLRFMKATFGTASTFQIHLDYIDAFGALPPTFSFLHYAIRYFSVTSPVFTGVFTGILQVKEAP